MDSPKEEGEVDKKRFDVKSVLESSAISGNVVQSTIIKESPSRPPRTHSRSSQLSISSSGRESCQSPFLTRIQRVSRSQSSSPSRTRNKSRHKSIREKFFEEEKQSCDDLNISVKHFNRKPSVETMVHVPVVQDSDGIEIGNNQANSRTKIKLWQKYALKSVFISFPLYILFGGLMFKLLSFISCPTSIHLYKSLLQFNETQHQEDNITLMHLWNLTLSLNVLHEKSWRSTASAEIYKYRTRLTDNILDFQSKKPDISTLPLSVSVLYSFSIVSMIGFPDECLNTHVTQSSLWQFLSMIYTTIGVPLFIYTLFEFTNNWSDLFYTFIGTLNSKSKKIFLFSTLIIYYPIMGFVIFSLTESKKPLLDLFNSITLVGPINCSYNPKGGEQVTIFHDVLIVLEVAYLFIGHSGLLLILRDRILTSITGINRQRNETRPSTPRTNSMKQLFNRCLSPKT